MWRQARSRRARAAFMLECVTGRHGAALSAERGAPQMADLAYALVFVAGFLVLVLTLRGLEKL
jgi:hypothetical protein